MHILLMLSMQTLSLSGEKQTSVSRTLAPGVRLHPTCGAFLIVLQPCLQLLGVGAVMLTWVHLVLLAPG
jgi:hypothetical protein